MLFSSVFSFLAIFLFEFQSDYITVLANILSLSLERFLIMFLFLKESVSSTQCHRKLSIYRSH